MTAATATARLGFARPADVLPDIERPHLSRIATQPIDAPPEAMFEVRDCPLIDLSAPGAPQPDLKTMGFDRIDLRSRPELVAHLEAVRKNGYLDAANARAIRRGMKGASFRLANGKRLKILFIAGEGFIMRQSGPNWIAPEAAKGEDANGVERGSPAVHGDQDVYGTPLKQIMRGAAPWLFRHNTPDGHNRVSPIFLLNIWLPLQQITQPLTLLDRRTLNKQRDQLRYALPTDSFLDRDEETRNNNIWLFLHDPAQRWYFHSEFALGDAYVFDTLGEAHTAAALAGEEVAEHLYNGLKAAKHAVSDNDSAALKQIACPQLSEVPAGCTPALQRAINNMHRLLDEACKRAAQECLAGDWLTRTDTALDAVVRKSLEMRAVAWVS